MLLLKQIKASFVNAQFLGDIKQMNIDNILDL